MYIFYIYLINIFKLIINYYKKNIIKNYYTKKFY